MRNPPYTLGSAVWPEWLTYWVSESSPCLYNIVQHNTDPDDPIISVNPPNGGFLSPWGTTNPLRSTESCCWCCWLCTWPLRKFFRLELPSESMWGQNFTLLRPLYNQSSFIFFIENSIGLMLHHHDMSISYHAEYVVILHKHCQQYPIDSCWVSYDEMTRGIC